MLLNISYTCSQVQEQVLFLIKIDDQTVVEKSLDGAHHQFIYQFDDSDASRLVRVIMSLQGKTHEHTVIDEQGNILSDCAVTIDSIVLDDINVTEIFCQGLECYTHDTNGTTPKFLDEFYGFLGCNGDVEIQFSLPIYRWFLDHCQ